MASSLSPSEGASCLCFQFSRHNVRSCQCPPHTPLPAAARTCILCSMFSVQSFPATTFTPCDDKCQLLAFLTYSLHDTRATGSTEGFLDDVERAVNDGVNAFKALTRDSRVVPAGGASEIELAHRVAEFGRKCTGAAPCCWRVVRWQAAIRHLHLWQCRTFHVQANAGTPQASRLQHTTSL